MSLTSTKGFLKHFINVKCSLFLPNYREVKQLSQSRYVVTSLNTAEASFRTHAASRILVYCCAVCIPYDIMSHEVRGGILPISLEPRRVPRTQYA